MIHSPSISSIEPAQQLWVSPLLTSYPVSFVGAFLIKPDLRCWFYENTGTTDPVILVTPYSELCTDSERRKQGFINLLGGTQPQTKTMFGHIKGYLEDDHNYLHLDQLLSAKLSFLTIFVSILVSILFPCWMSLNPLWYPYTKEINTPFFFLPFIHPSFDLILTSYSTLLM